MDDRERVLPVVKLLFIKGIVLLGFDLSLPPLPKRDHGIEGLPLLDRLPFGLVVLGGVLGFVLHPVVLDLHNDGIADIVGVLFNQLL